mmetsp:Transcript_20581/g.44979  ORF Transcript_20581/g.44979 Transcript_20581/m.44979 type:complete len:86 (+) Transcript_20581:871-1128(+)
MWCHRRCYVACRSGKIYENGGEIPPSHRGVQYVRVTDSRRIELVASRTHESANYRTSRSTVPLTVRFHQQRSTSVTNASRVVYSL